MTPPLAGAAPVTAPRAIEDRDPMLPPRSAVIVFLCFAFAYFFSALVRGVTATLAPEFSAEIGLNAGDLGLLAGAYFVGFAAMQLPLGGLLDRFGPRRVLVAFIAVAVIACAAFAMARGFVGLTLARALIGMGVSACLMAPMTLFRHRFSEVAQMRANSWMLMSGSFGMLASTLPVRWLLPVVGWRGLFWILALLFAAAMLLIARLVPRDGATFEPPADAPAAAAAGYAAVFRHPTFLRFAPMGFFHYGGMVAVQSLWAGPWLSQVCAYTPAQTALGLFAINASMLAAFSLWGALVPRMYARGWTAQRLIARGVPLSLLLLVIAVALGHRASAWAWALFCVSSTVVSLSQPAIGQAFAASLAGRAMSAYNLVIFLGIFVLQWGIGLAIDGFKAIHWSVESSFQGAFALMTMGCLMSYVWFLRRDDASGPAETKRRKPIADNRTTMPGLLIIAHEPLASSLKSVAQHAFPDCARVLEAFDVPPDMSIEEIELHTRELLARVRNPEALIFTDVFGATPCNVAQRLASAAGAAQVKVIAGVNVPMLWRCLCYADVPLDELVARAMTGATDGVMQVSVSRPQNQTVKPGGNDQDPDPHQQ
jgi:mannose/fructose-specific phosphotransferase system component IIA/MFS family permease